MEQTIVPDGKAEIELDIVRRAIKALSAAGTLPFHLVGEPVQNPEDDWDFSLPTLDGTQHLDLVEFAPLSRTAGSYDRVPQNRNNGDVADDVVALIARKEARYGSLVQRRVHLLIYTTDWRLTPPVRVERLVALDLSRRGTGFTSILYCSPWGSDLAHASILYPVASAAFEGFDEATVREEWTAHLQWKDPNSR